MKELYKRFLFTLFILVIFRLGSYIPLAGIDMQALELVTAQNQEGILGMFNILSGGSLGRMSIFALAIVPYITASIIIQLLSMAYKPLEELKKEGEVGKRKLTQLSRYLTIALAAVQAYGVAAGLERLGVNTQMTASAIIIASSLFKFTAVITLIAGTLLLMWLGEQITTKGLGNGSSLIIFTGIVSGLPGALISGFELARRGAANILVTLFLLVIVLLMIVIIVFFERAIRKVNIQYPKNKGPSLKSMPESNYIPLKLNTAGVIPPMFASSILLFPLTIANFTGSQSKFAAWLAYNLGHGRLLFIIIYAILIICFTFFYTALIFNTEDIAANLKRSGAIIPGKRPGTSTAQFLDMLLTRTSTLGALYLCIICIIPEFLMNKFAISFALGGTSLLIVVSVVLETFTQMQSYTFGNKYEALMKKMKFKNRRGLESK